MLRKARIKDIREIHSLINQYAKRDLMLPRSINELYETIRDFWVFIKKDKVVGCCSLHVSWGNLVEIKSLAVDKKYCRQGIGRQLIKACLKEAKELGAEKIFVLTYKPEYFRKFGFKRIDNAVLPHKIWAECINCPKFPDCKEVALVRNIK